MVDGCNIWGSRVVIQPQGHTKVLAQLHETQAGVNQMKALAWSYVWLSGLDTDIVTKVKIFKFLFVPFRNEDDLVNDGETVKKAFDRHIVDNERCIEANEK